MICPVTTYIQYCAKVTVASLALHFRYIRWRHDYCASKRKAACLVVNVGSVLALLITLALHCSVHVVCPWIGIEVCNDIIIKLSSQCRLRLSFACYQAACSSTNNQFLLLWDFSNSDSLSIQIGYSLQCSTVIVFTFQFLRIGPIKIVIKLGSMSNSVGKPIAVTVTQPNFNEFLGFLKKFCFKQNLHDFSTNLSRHLLFYSFWTFER